jgi:hypothetical protein
MAVLLMLEVPGGTQLTTAQNCGYACVWCGLYLPDGAGIVLGGVEPWRPASCPLCLAARGRWIDVYHKWSAHQGECADCIGMQRCDYATGYRTMFRAAHAATDKPPLRCVVCRWDIVGNDTFAPYRMEGLSAPVHFLTAHVPGCPPRTRHHPKRGRRGIGE